MRNEKKRGENKGNSSQHNKAPSPSNSTSLKNAVENNNQKIWSERFVKLNENVASPRKFWKTIKDIFPTKNGQRTKDNLAKEPMPSMQCNDQNLPGIFSEYYAKAARFLKEQAFPILYGDGQM